ncbi:hypothetical protein CspHIS471_0601910 [Cutaneotrichosporon sp. HIS471]|nr:hypothetical protein CspHIS471_0601910 [Cutaneotrichosporon sp. HIS471]
MEAIDLLDGAPPASVPSQVKRKRKGDATSTPSSQPKVKRAKEPATLAAAIPETSVTSSQPISAPTKEDDDRSKGQSDEEGEKDKHKESKEERRKRKEEKRRRKEEKAKRREEEGGERKRKHKGDDSKKSKKLKSSEVPAETLMADISKVVEDFVAASPAKEEKKKDEGAEGAAMTVKGKEKVPSDAADAAGTASPSPSSKSSSSSDPMDASSSEPEDDPMDASSPAASPARPPRVLPILTVTRSPTPPIKSMPKVGETSKDAAAKATKAGDGAKPKVQRKKKEAESVDEAEDEALREKLKDPEAAQEFLSSRWVDIPVLLRLEKKGIITWKRGKYTESEKAAVRGTLETFKRTHSVSDQEVVDIIFAKGRSSARSKYPGFWADVAGAVPGRPLRYVKEAVQRMYHPNAHKGPWTKEEDLELQRAYIDTPGQWVRIGDAVGRPYTDCRDRYRKQLEVSKERVSGRWTKEEEEQLKAAVTKVAGDLGRDMFDGDLPWPVVAHLMDGNRSFHQCRVKWQESMVPMLTGEGYNAPSKDVLGAMREFGYEHEKDIVWRDVSNHAKSHSKGAQATWRRMLAFVGAAEDKSLKEILDLMEAKLDDIVAQESGPAPSRVKKAPKAKRNGEPGKGFPPASSEPGANDDTEQAAESVPTPVKKAQESAKRKEKRRERLAAARGESDWLGSATVGSQAEAWMDSVVASGRDRSVSARSSVSAGASASAVRSRKVSFEGDE